MHHKEFFEIPPCANKVIFVTEFIIFVTEFVILVQNPPFYKQGLKMALRMEEFQINFFGTCSYDS